MPHQSETFALKTRLSEDYATALEHVREALAAEGFGVITEIDMRATMKAKLDADMQPYMLLGACSPPIAHAALMEDLDIGLLLPCNVAVYEGSNPQETIVAAIDPVVQLGVTGNEGVGPMAAEVRAKLARVLDALAGA